MKLARVLAMALTVLCVALRLCLPAVDVCWHSDGQLCDEVVPQSCCGTNAPAGDPADDGCADCTDLHLEPGSSPSKSPGVAKPVGSDSGFPLPLMERPIAAGERSTSPAILGGAAPPDHPLRHSSLPLRC